MAKHDSTESEPEESETLGNSSSEEEPENPSNGREKEISGYEKQRLSRIAENRARMEALGLSKMASSLMGSVQKLTKRKGKRKVPEDDEDYNPVDGEDDDGDSDDGDSDDGIDDEDEDFLGPEVSSSRKKKVKNKGSKESKHKNKVPAQKRLSSSGHIDEDDDELMRAIALSLQGVSEALLSGPSQFSDTHLGDTTPNKGNANAHNKGVTGRKKKKKLFNSRVLMTEDELIVHFFQFDESGVGGISVRDLRRVAVAHDFTWTEKELADMIHCFDSDGDGKLNLDDFRNIAGRCNMIQGSGKSR